jgi:hypothetical protein
MYLPVICLKIQIRHLKTKKTLRQTFGNQNRICHLVLPPCFFAKGTHVKFSAVAKRAERQTREDRRALATRYSSSSKEQRAERQTREERKALATLGTTSKEQRAERQTRGERLVSLYHKSPKRCLQVKS